MTLPALDQLSPEMLSPRLRALILLGGTVRPTKLHESIGRSILDLPIDNDRTLLRQWQQRVHDLVEQRRLGELMVRVVIDRQSPQPKVPVADGCVAISIERDPAEFRGTGGILRDLTAHYDDEDYILFANASQIILEPLPDLLELLTKRSGDVTMISDEEGVAGSLILIKCGCLRDLPEIGFIDFKEQALSRIAVNHTIAVVEHPKRTALAVRSGADYIASLLEFHRTIQGNPIAQSPFAEDWEPSFAIVEEGAEVADSARVHDSVVLKGARLEANALAVRCVVCPGAVIRSGEMIVDEIVTSTSRRGRGGDL